MTKIWITRTQPASQRSAKAWKAVGFDPVVAPLLEVEPVENEDDLSDKSVLIFTSSHAVRHSALRGDNRLVYTIGEATAKAAQKQGFSNIVVSHGDWTDLLGVIEATDHPLIHVSGETVQGQLVERLISRGLQARRHIVYRTKPVEDWPVRTRDLQSVALYSPRASEVLMSLPGRDLSHLMAYCLSPNVAAPLSDMRTKIADCPTEAALIACSTGPEV
jgi:uroporphyrinogen-III synthase